MHIKYFETTYPHSFPSNPSLCPDHFSLQTLCALKKILSLFRAYMCMELVPSPEARATSQRSTSLKKLAVLQEPRCLQLGVVLHERFPHPSWGFACPGFMRVPTVTTAVS